MTKGFSRFKKSIAVIAVFYMIFALVPINSYAFETSDISNHWAKDKIQNWMDQGLIKGYKDGTFKPDNNITRAEFMSLVNGAFGFTDSVEINYSDVDANAWYKASVATAKAAKYISGYPDNTIRPNNPISRAEAASIIMKINNLKTDSYGSAKFIDEGSFGWSKNAVNAVSAANIMNGYPDGSFRPQEFIKRGEAVAALDKALTYGEKNITYSKAGTYGPATGVSETEGNVTVAEKDIILQNTQINGNLIIDKNVSDGNVTLKNVTVKGETKIYGGGQNSIIVIDSTLGKVTVSKEDGKIRVVVTGKTTVGLVQANSGVKLEENNLAQGSDGFREILLDAANNNEIILIGSFDKVTVESEGLEIHVPKGTTIAALTINKKASLIGAGIINTANINVSGVTFETAPKKIVVAPGVSEPTIGVPTGGGGGGGGPTTPPPATLINITTASAVGIPRVGYELTAVAEPAGATASYQWQISDEIDGTYQSIAGAASNRYVPIAADAGKFIKVVATGTGSFTGTAESEATTAIETPDSTVSFSMPTARGTYFTEMGYSLEIVNQIEAALWGAGDLTVDTTWGAIEVKRVFSRSADGSRLTIYANNISQSLLEWLEHDLYTTGNLAIGINFSGGQVPAENEDDRNILNGGSGTSLTSLSITSLSWEDSTIRVNLHDLAAGINYGSIIMPDGTRAYFEVETEGDLIPVDSVKVTSSATTISVDDGNLQMNVDVMPLTAYDKTVRWSVVNESGAALIINEGHDAGVLYAGKNGTVQVYATSAMTGVRSAPFEITISGQVRPAAPSGIGKTDETYAGANNGTLTGVMAGQEYQVNGAGPWISISGTTVTGLAPGSYTVRTAETELQYASDPTAPLVIEASDIILITGFDPITDVSAGTAGSATYADAAAVLVVLPTTVTANSGAVTVPVTAWEDTDKYDPSVARSYTFTATLGEIPLGFTNSGNRTATVEVLVTP